MKSQMTDLALAGKCGGFGASGSALGVASPSWASSEPSASRPKPLPARARNWRREGKAGDSGANRREWFIMLNSLKGDSRLSQLHRIGTAYPLPVTHAHRLGQQPLDCQTIQRHVGGIGNVNSGYSTHPRHPVNEGRLHVAP